MFVEGVYVHCPVLDAHADKYFAFGRVFLVVLVAQPNRQHAAEHQRFLLQFRFFDLLLLRRAGRGRFPLAAELGQILHSLFSGLDLGGADGRRLIFPDRCVLRPVQRAQRSAVRNIPKRLTNWASMAVLLLMRLGAATEWGTFRFTELYSALPQ